MTWIFRLPLRNIKALAILVPFLISVYVGVILNGSDLIELAYYICPAVFGLLLFFFIMIRSSWEQWEMKVDNYYPHIFFFVAGIFGFIHIYNYNESAFSWWMVPILIMPQFILALFLGFVRLRVGFWACIYMHALNNLIPTLLVFNADKLLEG